MSFKTADLSDQHPNCAIAEPIFFRFGGAPRFHGRIRTVKVLDDNLLVRQMLEGSGDGSVLVVDGQGSTRGALLGDQLAALAVKNGWTGVIINGCLRDSADIANVSLGVRALATHPKKSGKTGAGERDVPVTFAGVTFRPGDFVYVDEDGILLSPHALL